MANSAPEKDAFRLKFVGSVYEVWAGEDATSSINDLIKSKGAGNVKAYLARGFAQRDLLAKTGTIQTAGVLAAEDDGFWALRPMPLRFYFWYSNNRMIISHIIWKKEDALDPADKTRMNKNRLLYQAWEQKWTNGSRN